MNPAKFKVAKLTLLGEPGAVFYEVGDLVEVVKFDHSDNTALVKNLVTDMLQWIDLDALEAV